MTSVGVHLEASRLPATPQEKIEALIGFIQAIEIPPNEAIMLCLTVAVRIADVHGAEDDPAARQAAMAEIMSGASRETLTAIYGDLVEETQH